MLKVPKALYNDLPPTVALWLLFIRRAIDDRPYESRNSFVGGVVLTRPHINSSAMQSFALQIMKTSFSNHGVSQIMQALLANH